MKLTSNNPEVIAQVKEYISKHCCSENCTNKHKIDACGWCYVEHLKEINLNKLSKRGH